MQTTDFTDDTDKIEVNPIREIRAVRGLLVIPQAIIPCREKSDKERFALFIFGSNSDLTFAVLLALGGRN
jgi:hypothetical protein